MNKLIPIAGYSLIALCGFWGAKTVWNVYESFQSISVATEVNAQGNQNSLALGMDKSITQANVFGLYQEPVRQQPQATPRPQPTKPPQVNLPPLGFKITGPWPGIGAHIAPGPRQNSKWFKIGDDIFGKAKLVEVLANGIVVERNGQREEIIWDESKGGTAGLGPSLSDVVVSNEMAGAVISGAEPTPQPTIERPAGIGRGNGRGASFNPTGRKPAASPTPQPQVEIPRTQSAVQSMVNNAVSQAKQNPNDFLVRYGLQQANGGYKVTSNAVLLMAAGLRPGDLIVEVNDMKVGNPAQDVSRIDGVMASGRIKVEFVRNGQRYKIEQNF